MYAKIFQKIFDSSIAEDWQQRVVFQDILILCDRDGVVNMTHEAISRRTNVPIGIVRESIAKLESPDPKSNTSAEDGRRLERVDEHRDWGWRIINYEKYRNIKNSVELRAATRVRVARWRKKQKEERPEKGELKPTLEGVRLYVSKCGLSESDACWFWNKCEANGWTNGGRKIKSWQHTIASWKSAGYMPSQKNQPKKPESKEIQEQIEIKSI